MIAYGTNVEGHREIPGFGVNENESSATWTEFLMGLKRRGLTGLLMITSDAHDGILNAIGKVFSHRAVAALPVLFQPKYHGQGSKDVPVRAPDRTAGDVQLQNAG